MKSTRRAFVIAQAACLCSLEAEQSGSAKLSPLPKELAGIRVADSKYTRIAMEALLDTSPGFLINHAMRTFYFGALIGRHEKMQVDSELLFLACALHDLGLTPTYEGPRPFEIQGAQAARNLLSTAGLTAEKTQIVWDGIAMHPHSMSEFRQPEVALVGAGAGADVVGGGLEEIAHDDVQAVLEAFPRLDFKRQFLKNCGNRQQISRRSQAHLHARHRGANQFRLQGLEHLRCNHGFCFQRISRYLSRVAV